MSDIDINKVDFDLGSNDESPYREQFEKETDSYPYVEDDYSKWLEKKLEEKENRISYLIGSMRAIVDSAEKHLKEEKE